MSFLQSEPVPDDPDRLPPARRRRIYRLLVPLDADQRAAFLGELAHRTSPTFDFFLFSLLSASVLSLGLLLDTPALLLLGILVAPVMSPVIGLSFGTVTGSLRFFFRSFVGLLIGSALVFTAGALVGIVTYTWMPSTLEQAHFFAQISWPNFIVLAVGAILTAATMINSERSPAVPSIALAYQLYIPLAVAGFGLSSGIPDLFPDGLVIFTIYLAWAALLGAVTFALMGLRPLTLFGYTLGGVIGLVCIILLIGFSSISAVVTAQIGLPTSHPTITPTLTPVPPSPTLTTTSAPPTETTTFTPAPPTATVTLTPTSTLSPTPTPVFAFVKDALGGRIRAEPNFDGMVVAWLNKGDLLQVLPETVDTNGTMWAHVIQVSSGKEGWIIQTNLIAATPAPGW